MVLVWCLQLRDTMYREDQKGLTINNLMRLLFIVCLLLLDLYETLHHWSKYIKMDNRRIVTFILYFRKALPSVTIDRRALIKCLFFLFLLTFRNHRVEQFREYIQANNTRQYLRITFQENSTVPPSFARDIRSYSARYCENSTF